jgi:xylan 1,4-beta-xylosidase
MTIKTKFSCDLGNKPMQLRHPWQHCVGSDHATTALRADWQTQLRRARGDLGFHYVRFHGLLDDDMGTLICQDNQFVFSFFNIDRIFDFLLSIGMKPIVELGFMPATLSSGGDIVFHYKGNITPPKDERDWSLLMTKLATHWVERYGIDEVAQWPLEVWNEPNLPAFWKGDQAAYFALYLATWQAMKAVSPRLQVGGPATAQNAWLLDFNGFCDANGCPPDFISTHYYPTDAFGEIGSDTITQLEHAPMGVMRDRAMEARKVAGRRPLYYTEWNITSNPRDPMHDGSFCAALAVKLCMSVDDLVDAYSWWVFSDIFEENYFPSMPYHGGFGLLNLYGIPKPVYRGFELMKQLGTQHWPVQGSHDTVSVWVGAHEAATIQALIVNVAMPRHAIGAESVELRLPLVGRRKVRAVTLYRIDAEHANPLAAWESIGKPEYLKPDQVETLQAASRVLPETWPFQDDGDELRIDLVIAAQSVALVRIEWV